MKKFTEP